jgi:hypothetical protein
MLLLVNIKAEIAGLSGRVRLGERNERDTISLRVLSLTSQHLLQVLYAPAVTRSRYSILCHHVPDFEVNYIILLTRKKT